ncbi:MAG: hypothetical protein P8Y95_02995, partial [Gammaproteobacteria bacterium]
SGDSSSEKVLQRATDEQVAEAVAVHNENVSDEEDRVICTRETVVGSHFSRRICRTVRQIEEEREMTLRDLEDRYDPVSGPQ